MDHQDDIQRNGVYSSNLPVLPRVQIPPFAKRSVLRQLIDHTISTAQLPFLSLYDWQAYGHFEPTQFSWKYEQRREAQMILPYLYLGPLASSRDKAFLQREGISLILAVLPVASAVSSMGNNLRAVAKEDMQVQILGLANDDALVSLFREAANLIGGHVASMATTAQRPNILPRAGKVLVVCESGNERAAAVVTAYLMGTFGCDLVQAVQALTERRFCIALDDSLRHKLFTFEELLAAKRMVHESQPSIASDSATTLHRSKRSHDDENDDNAHDDDVSRFQDRGFAPFTAGT